MLELILLSSGEQWFTLSIKILNDSHDARIGALTLLPQVTYLAL